MKKASTVAARNKKEMEKALKNKQKKICKANR